MPNISGSTPKGGGVSLRCFGKGRLVLVFPIAEETGHAFGKPSEPKQFMKCNVVALPDGAPSIQLPTGPVAPLPPFITFGGEANNDGSMKTPDTMRIDVGPQGTLFENVSIGGGGMLYILRKALRNGEARVGRLWQDPAYNGAWKLTDVEPGTPEMKVAADWLVAYSTGNFTNPVPVPLQVIPQQAAPQQQYAQQAPPAQSWPSNPAPQPATAGAWGAQVQQNTPPAQQGWGAPQPQPVAAQQPQQGWGAPQQVAPPAQQGWGAPAQDPNAGQPSPGF